MPENVSAYRVFIASPSGLEPERRKFREILDEWNEMFSLDRGVAFYPIGWEDTLPGIGRPQSLINSDVRKSDFLVLLLWDRWGTPPGGDGSYTSGTEEEFSIANDSITDPSNPMRQIVVLFKGVDPRQLNDPGEQLKKVIAFKKRLEKEKSFLYGSFDTPEEFGKHLQRQLWRWASDLEQGGDGKSAPPPGGPIIPLPPSNPPDAPPKSGPADTAESSLTEQAQRLADQGRLADAEAKFVTAILKETTAEPFLRYSEFLRRVGRLEQAQVIISEALRIATASNDDEGVAQAYGNLGVLHETRGNLDKAEAMYRKALEINEKLGQLEGMANDYGNLGNVYSTRGDLERAEEMLRKSLKISEKLGRLEGMATQYGNLGLIHQTRGDLERAEEMHRKALEINNKFGWAEGMAASYGNLGLIHQKRGDLEKAEEMLRKSLEIDEKLGRLEGMANQYGNLGVVHQMRGNLDQAELMHCRSLEISEKLGRLEGMAAGYGNLGLIHQERGDLDKAEQILRKSLEIFEKFGGLDGMANQYGNLGSVAEQRGDPVAARELWIKARDLFENIGMPHMVAQTQRWLDGLPPDDSQ